MEEQVLFNVYTILYNEVTHGDVNSIIVEDEGGVNAGKFGIGHFDYIICDDW